jgi:hypothetical protein
MPRPFRFFLTGVFASIFISTPLFAGRLLDEFRAANRLETRRFIRGPTYGMSATEKRRYETAEREDRWKSEAKEADARRAQRERDLAKEKENDEWFRRPFRPPSEDPVTRSSMPFFDTLDGSRAALTIDRGQEQYTVELKVSVFGAGLFSRRDPNVPRGTTTFGADNLIRTQIEKAFQRAEAFLTTKGLSVKIHLSFEDDTRAMEAALTPVSYRDYRRALMKGLDRLKLTEEALPILIEPYPGSARYFRNLMIQPKQDLAWCLFTDPILLAQKIMEVFGFPSTSFVDPKYPVDSLMSAPLESLLYWYFTKKTPGVSLREFHRAGIDLTLNSPTMLRLMERTAEEARTDLTTALAGKYYEDPPKETLVINLKRLKKMERIELARQRLSNHPALASSPPSIEACMAALKVLGEQRSKKIFWPE